MEPAQDLDHLLARRRELASRGPDAGRYASRLRALRSWQAARLAHTYRDLHYEPRYAAALDFFFSDLYGPGDFAPRDRELMRAWHYLKRALPATLLQVLRRAIELDVLTAELDQAMVAVLGHGEIGSAQYAQAYREVGRRDARQRQIDLIIGAGEDLERTVRHAWLGGLLRVAHAPAHAAGFGVLQDFLECGYDAFRRMGGARVLLEAIRQRETVLMEALLADGEAALALLGCDGGDAHA